METINEMPSQVKTSKESVLNNALKYGLYTACAYVLVSLMIYALGIDKITWLNYLTYIIMIAGIVLATINYRDKINGGLITYGKGVSTGVIIGGVVGVVMAIYLWIFFTYINPNGIRELLEMTEQKLAEQGLSDEMIDKQMTMSGKFIKMPLMNIFGMIGYIFSGLIISLITSAILKKNDDSFNATFNQ
ncbi:MAG: DUF4199 domain-containing protein [Omnitrophica WOR_2 bacterium]|jgi:hypothetical protein